MNRSVTADRYIRFPHKQQQSVHNTALYIKCRIFLNMPQQTLVHKYNIFLEKKREKQIMFYSFKSSDENVAKYKTVLTNKLYFSNWRLFMMGRVLFIMG